MIHQDYDGALVENWARAYLRKLDNPRFKTKETRRRHIYLMLSEIKDTYGSEAVEKVLHRAAEIIIYEQ